MKRYTSIYKAALLPLVAALVFASCDNLLSPPPNAKAPSAQAGKASVSITVSDARTVLPEVNPNELTYTLKGEKDGTEKLNMSISGNGTSLALDAGEWTFTLNALKGGDIVLTSDAPPITLKADEGVRVDFTLKPIKEGNGAVNINFVLPPGITKVETDGDIPAETIDLSSANGAWNYQEEMSAHDYFTTFTFKRGDKVAAVVSEIIQVRKGLTSKKTITLPVKYNTLKPGWNSGSVAAGGEQWFTFTASTVNQSIYVKFGTLTDLSLQVYYKSASEPLTDSNLGGGRTYTYTSLSDLSPGQVYSIRISPTGGLSGNYEIMVSDLEPGTRLPAPRNLKAVPYEGMNLVSWDVVKDAVGYDIYRRETETGIEVLLDTTIYTNNYYFDFVAWNNQLVDQHTYTYTVVTLSPNAAGDIQNGHASVNAKANIPAPEVFNTNLETMMSERDISSIVYSSGTDTEKDSVLIKFNHKPNLKYQIAYTTGADGDTTIIRDFDEPVPPDPDVFSSARVAKFPLIGGLVTASVKATFGGGINYYDSYVIRAITIEVVPADLPAVTGFSTYQAQDTVDLQWDNLPDADKYTIYRAELADSFDPITDTTVRVKTDWAVLTGTPVWTAESKWQVKVPPGDMAKNYVYGVLGSSVTGASSKMAFATIP